MLYFLALAWHTGSGVGTKFPLDDLPQPWNWLYYAVHASAYTAVLFLAGIFGERPKSGKEVILATQRALEQQALERWRLQKEAQIEQMMRDGVPLGAVAAALASAGDGGAHRGPGSGDSGGLSALDAARLNVGVRDMTSPCSMASTVAWQERGTTEEDGEEPAAWHPLCPRGPSWCHWGARGTRNAVVTVALTDGVPHRVGDGGPRRTTPQRDAALARLGIRPFASSNHGGVKQEG